MGRWTGWGDGYGYQYRYIHMRITLKKDISPISGLEKTSFCKYELFFEDYLCEDGEVSIVARVSLSTVDLEGLAKLTELWCKALGIIKKTS